MGRFDYSFKISYENYTHVYKVGEWIYYITHKEYHRLLVNVGYIF
jgi:hypothetical protein